MSTVSVRGLTVCGCASALRKNRFAAAGAPCSQLGKSIVCPRLSHRPIEIHPTSLHPDIGLVHRQEPLLIRRCGRIRFSRILGMGLDPTKDRCVVDLDAAVEEHQFEIAVADGKHPDANERPTGSPQR